MLDLPVLFTFGHGLSYTKFSYSDLKVEVKGNKVKVSVKVENVGERAGKEVVQVYVSQKNPSIRRPKKELKAFKKVGLEKGESKVVEISLELKYAASFWDEVREAWIVEKGEFELLVGGSSSGEGALTGGFEVGKTWWWNGL
jgi:beta-glucosidase